MIEKNCSEHQSEPEKYNDAGDGTCMDCGREKDECYCGIIPSR